MNMKADFNCEKCELGLLDTEEHAKICEGQEEERIGLDLDQLEYTVEFFTWILKKKGADSGAGPGAAVQETPGAASGYSAWSQEDCIALDAVLIIDRLLVVEDTLNLDANNLQTRANES